MLRQNHHFEGVRLFKVTAFGRLQVAPLRAIAPWSVDLVFWNSLAVEPSRRQPPLTQDVYISKISGNFMSQKNDSPNTWKDREPFDP